MPWAAAAGISLSKHDRPPGWVYGLACSSSTGAQVAAPALPAEGTREICPPARPELAGGWAYQDASTDDARLVPRVLAEARRAGGRIELWSRDRGAQRRSTGLRPCPARRRMQPAVGAGTSRCSRSRLMPREPGPINCERVPAAPRIRPCAAATSSPEHECGSPALVFHRGSGPFSSSWEGVTLVGTTDVDHWPALDTEPAMEPAELDYLLAAVDYAFPTPHLCAEHITAPTPSARRGRHRQLTRRRSLVSMSVG
jgi:glycerol-3-phosphate dehydrogenase